jgi:hypothetical protein
MILPPPGALNDTNMPAEAPITVFAGLYRSSSDAKNDAGIKI